MADGSEVHPGLKWPTDLKVNIVAGFAEITSETIDSNTCHGFNFDPRPLILTNLLNI